MQIPTPLSFIVNHFGTSRLGEPEHSMPMRFNIGIGDQMLESFAAFSSQDQCQTFINNFPETRPEGQLVPLKCSTAKSLLNNLNLLAQEPHATKWIVLNPNATTNQTGGIIKLADAITALKDALQE